MYMYMCARVSGVYMPVHAAPDCRVMLPHTPQPAPLPCVCNVRRASLFFLAMRPHPVCVCACIVHVHVTCACVPSWLTDRSMGLVIPPSSCTTGVAPTMNAFGLVRYAAVD